MSKIRASLSSPTRPRPVRASSSQKPLQESHAHASTPATSIHAAAPNQKPSDANPPHRAPSTYTDKTPHPPAPDQHSAPPHTPASIASTHPAAPRSPPPPRRSRKPSAANSES